MWGAVKSMSWQFYAAYADEAYAVLSEDFIASYGQNAAGFACHPSEGPRRPVGRAAGTQGILRSSQLVAGIRTR